MALYWTRFTTKNVKYIHDVDLPGCVMLVMKGRNKKGKSLVLKLFKNCFVKRHDPDLIADGFDECTYSIELSDRFPKGEHSIVITRHQTRTDAEPEVTFSDGRAAPSALETFLKQLSSGFGLDPFDMIPSDKNTRDRREKFLREVLPVRFKGADVARMMGKPGIPDELDVAQFDAYLAGAEQTRTDLGRERDALEGTVAIMAETVSASDEDAVDHALRANDLERKIQQTKKVWDDDEEKIKETFRKVEKERLEKLADEIKKRTDELRELAKAEIGAWAVERDSRVSDVAAQRSAAVSGLTEELGQERALAKGQVERQALRRAHDEQRLRRDQKAREAAKAQMVVDQMREHRAQAFREVGVEGVEYSKGGQLMVDGKDFDTELNRTEQRKVAVLLASRAKKEVRVMIADDTESFDPVNEQWLYEAIKEAGFQMIRGEVSGDVELKFECR
jgi:hypothetical protein